MSEHKKLKEANTKPHYISSEYLTFDQNGLNSKVMPGSRGRSVLGSGCSSAAVLCLSYRRRVRWINPRLPPGAIVKPIQNTCKCGIKR